MGYLSIGGTTIINNIGGILDVNGTPVPVNEGDIWRDTSQVPPKLMTYKNGVVRELDVVGDTEFQDLSGNTITLD